MAAFDPTSNPTTTTSANHIYFTHWVVDSVLDETRAYTVSRQGFRVEGKHTATSIDFPVMHKPAAATSNYTEGTGLANTQLSTDVATATAVSNGQAATITDELEEVAVVAAVPYFSGVLGRSCAEEFETTAAALFAGFSNTSGATGVACSYAVILDSVNKLAQRDMKGDAMGVLKPGTIGNVRIDLGTSGAAALANESAGPLSPGTMEEGMNGFCFSLAGADWYQTSVVSSSGGGVFIKNQAVGLYEIRPTRIETIRVPNLPGTEVVSTTRYGVIEIRDASGQTILSS